ncbi:unnamed protein product [Adineta steineri]|uniref:Uncharacterized protein n=1 Tax=Adineta steineri TaxID=433720 RepID=A0A819UZ93_9BILA|nr:unnamed protein product [Adineta steineri]CAF4103751.1 unnamed protein product [Adineta steineri]
MTQGAPKQRFTSRDLLRYLLNKRDPATPCDGDADCIALAAPCVDNCDGDDACINICHCIVACRNAADPRVCQDSCYDQN